MTKVDNLEERNCLRYLGFFSSIVRKMLEGVELLVAFSSPDIGGGASLECVLWTRWEILACRLHPCRGARSTLLLCSSGEDGGDCSSTAPWPVTLGRVESQWEAIKD